MRLLVTIVISFFLTACISSDHFLKFSAGKDSEFIIPVEEISKAEVSESTDGRTLLILTLNATSQSEIFKFTGENIGKNLSLSFDGKNIISNIPIREATRMSETIVTIDNMAEANEIARSIND